MVFRIPSRDITAIVSARDGHRRKKVRVGRQFKAVLLVLVLYAAAAAKLGAEEARLQIERALAEGHGVAEFAPSFVGGRGTAPASLVEALKALRCAALLDAFGGNWVFLERAFVKGYNPPVVTLNARHLSPLRISVFIDGVRVEDPGRLLSLAQSIETSGKWKQRDPEAE